MPLDVRRQAVTVSPVDPSAVDVGDIVMCRVAGTTYLRLVSAVDHGRARVSTHGAAVGDAAAAVFATASWG